MSHRVCPWWIGYVLLNPLRRLRQNPNALLAPYVREGMTVFEPGPGMGFFTLELARRVGSTGRVIAVDIQPKMFAGLRKRADRNGLLPRIDARLAKPDSLGIDDLKSAVDFTLACAVVHELPDVGRFFGEAAAAAKPGSTLLLIEPRGHVKNQDFEAELIAAREAGFSVRDRPASGGTWTAVLERAGRT